MNELGRYGMKNKKIIIVAAVLLLIVLGLFYRGSIVSTASSSNKLTKQQKTEDFNFIYNALRDNFPYFEVGKRKTGFDWLAHKEEFKKEISKTKSDDEFYIKMNEILKLVQNAHTHVFDYSFYEYCKNIPIVMAPWFDIVNNEEVKDTYENWIKDINNGKKTYVVPIVFQYIEGKYAAINTVSNTFDYYGITEGSILTEVNGVGINEYIKTLINKGYIHFDNTKGEFKKAGLTIQTDKKEKVELSIINPDGTKIKKKIQTEEYAQNTSASFLNNKNNLYTRILEKDKTAYMRIKSFGANYVASDTTQIFEFLKGIKEYPNLIIDIRGNGGGSDAYWGKNIMSYLVNEKLSVRSYLLFRDGKYLEPFAENKLSTLNLMLQPISNLPIAKNYPEEIKSGFKDFVFIDKQFEAYNSIGFKGKIYLLVDSGVYSGAESFAAFAKASGWATLVGTETGGDGIGFDPAFAVMPNSKLVIRFPMVMALNPDGTANEETHTNPDIYVEQSYSDILKHMDWSKQNKEEIISPYDTILNKVLDIIK
jgi:C-terminal processing protease CtpA/Prc